MVGRDISASLKLDVVLERIAWHAKDLLCVETSALYLSDPVKPLLHAVAALGPDAREIMNDPLVIGEGILGNIALQQAGEIVNDTFKDPRAITIAGTESGDVYEHIMGAPVLMQNELTGLIAVWRTGERQEFIAADLDFLKNLASQVAVAIENARLFENTQERLAEIQALHSVSKALRVAQSLDEALPIILDQLMDLMSAGGASLELVDPASGEIVTELAKGEWAAVTGLADRLRRRSKRVRHRHRANLCQQRCGQILPGGATRSVWRAARRGVRAGDRPAPTDRSIMGRSPDAHVQGGSQLAGCDRRAGRERHSSDEIARADGAAAG